MKIQGSHYRTIWPASGAADAHLSSGVRVIDQTRLPFTFITADLFSMNDAAHAIRAMIVRGAPLIGATAAYGLALGLRADASDAGLAAAAATLKAARPTAVNLAWAVDRVSAKVATLPVDDRAAAAWAEAAAIADADVEQCRAIGQHGLGIIKALAAKAGKSGKPLNILTHCNAGWLACVDWGTALAPIYMAFDAGVPVHVWVDETRPRNQGASLTAYELGAHGVPHTVIADNTGGLLMQRGEVDMAIVGSDRTVANGDVCNKVGTYLKALAAHDNGVPFYVALPSSTIDFEMQAGSLIPIEERDARELTHMSGRTEQGTLETVRIVPEGSPALNPAFDVTPARLVTGLITERGVCAASRAGLRSLFPEMLAAAE
ncbi:MAG: S-methyl-5-thioribose-1-phosphate isomerase [Rhodospirillaceae bacterium]|nr:S-methyl-5-thioribose-1-phosphate isomerase [Rhodospirillaceae bacterium]